MMLQAYLSLLLNPIFWLLVLFIGMQFNKINNTKKNLYGVEGAPVWQVTLLATTYGVIGGIFGSIFMVVAGISISEIGIIYLWMVAIILLLVSPRFLCFSYAGSILSMSYLIFGWPSIEVPHLMGLVAILHLVESFLIITSGHLSALPVYVKNAYNQTVGAFSLQKFWPIPIIALMVAEGTMAEGTGAMVDMPEWWPLIESFKAESLDKFHYLILPVIAALGYGDVAISNTPESKGRSSAALLAVYSIILLLLSAAASKIPFISILPALFGALGHELVIWIGKNSQLKGEPLYIASNDGVKVLDVLKNSRAHKFGLKRGDIIYSINNVRVINRFQLKEELEEETEYLEVEYIDANNNRIYRKAGRVEDKKKFGIIPVPETYEQPQVQFKTQGVLTRWLKKKFKGLKE